MHSSFCIYLHGVSSVVGASYTICPNCLAWVKSTMISTTVYRLLHTNRPSWDVSFTVYVIPRSLHWRSSYGHSIWWGTTGRRSVLKMQFAYYTGKLSVILSAWIDWYYRCCGRCTCTLHGTPMTKMWFTIGRNWQKRKSNWRVSRDIRVIRIEVHDRYGQSKAIILCSFFCVNRPYLNCSRVLLILFLVKWVIFQ